MISCFLFTCILACKNSSHSQEETASVYIKKTEKGYQLIRNGKPFYIKGAAGNGYYEELKMAGGNTIRSYDTIDLKKTLDEAHSMGLAVIADIPLPEYDDDYKVSKEELSNIKRKVEKLVSQYKDHPSLLYWNLGNELNYPAFYTRTSFFSHFNELIDIIHTIDPNHPVSTAVIAGSRRTLISITLRSPKLDFISLNSFGSLTGLKETFESISLIWDGPYVISEWGTNGPWEEEKTHWDAPIEPTSTKKAEILKERYHSAVLQDDACLGSIVFYWGKKQERTPTWFTIFNEDHLKSQVYYELGNLWKNTSISYTGPEINYALLNKKGAPSSIVVSPGEEAEAELFLQPVNDSLQYTWEVREEAWFDIMEEPPAIDGLSSQKHGKTYPFTVPKREGPYRVYVYVKDNKGNFATTNVPFYVLNPENGE